MSTLKSWQITAVAATLNDCGNNYMQPFTEEQLKLLASSAVGKPVATAFDMGGIIGFVTAASVVKQKLVIEAEVTEQVKGLVMAPGYLLPQYESVVYGVIAPETAVDNTLIAITVIDKK